MLLVAHDLGHQPPGRADDAGLKYLTPALASSPLPSYQRAKPEVTCCSPLRVVGSSALRSWSMSTIGSVRFEAITASSSSSSLEFGPGTSVM